MKSESTYRVKFSMQGLSDDSGTDTEMYGFKMDRGQRWWLRGLGHSC